VHNCPQPLPTNVARYCDAHADRESLCAAEGCISARRTGFRTCAKPEHVQLEEQYNSTGTSFKVLRNRLARAEAYSIGSTFVEEADEEGEEDEEEESASNEEPQKNETKTKAKAKAQFGRRRTHNEQLVVRPCGVIIGRATFYGAESLSAVADFLQMVFPTAISVPDVLFYDNNCQLHRYVADRPNLQAFFQATAMLVDLFHFGCKHKKDDVYCSLHCNATAFPHLYDSVNKKWLFNSSACEQANVWLNKFKPMVRGMGPVQFEFFLDEVIKARNRFIVKELKKNKHSPSLIPRSALL